MKPSKYSLTRRTALVMHRVMKDGTEFSSAAIREAVDGVDGASARYVTPAARWLRDHGIAVATRKLRHHTVWLMPLVPRQMDEYGRQMVTDSYNEIRANVRSCATLHGAGSRRSKQRLIRCAIELGDYLGLSVAEVTADCAPLTTAKAVNGTS